MNPTGLCKCGCGKKTTIASKTNTRNGHIKGAPVNYLKGHAAWASNYGPKWLVDEETGCWVWRRMVNNKGYAMGQFGSRGLEKITLVHRYHYEQMIGPIPAGHVIDHICNNPPCVNPEHLRPTTQRFNVLRQATTKLTDADVRRAIMMHTGGMSWRRVAEALGVTHPPLLARVKRLREAQPDWLLPK